MKKNVYFAGSIRGGREDAALYHELIEYINKTDHVLTEMVGDMNHSVRQQARSEDAMIYDRDTAWLRACDMVIAECTRPSLGVGYELAYAEAHQKPVHVLYRPKEVQLSAMLTGNPYFHIHAYENKAEIFEIITSILNFED